VTLTESECSVSAIEWAVGSKVRGQGSITRAGPQLASRAIPPSIARSMWKTHLLEPISSARSADSSVWFSIILGATTKHCEFARDASAVKRVNSAGKPI